MHKTFIIICLFYTSIVQAKVHRINAGVNHVSGIEHGVSAIKPGDTIYLENGQRGAIQFADITGSPGKPVIIINAGGLCEIKEHTLPYGISFRHCHYIGLSGNGAKEFPYGIKISEVSRDGAGLGISDKSDHIEICFIEICNTKGPGILCKTNADCNTYKENYTSLNTSIHNNYVHHTGTEGMYIGSTAFEGTVIKCDTSTIKRFPPVLKNVWVFDNVVTYTGWDGIQISNAINVTCHGNKISFDSQKNEPWQNCGLIIGGGTSGKFFDNTISNGKGYPVNCFGSGLVEIFNNRINADSTTNKTAIYVNDKLADKKSRYIIKGNIITTRHLPAITVINKKNRVPDLLEGNHFMGINTTGAVSFEGTAPVIK